MVTNDSIWIGFVSTTLDTKTKKKSLILKVEL
jgi:hypothetical protein